MSRFSERNSSTMVGETPMPNMYRLGGGAFAAMNPFTMFASATTYMTRIGIPPSFSIVS